MKVTVLKNLNMDCGRLDKAHHALIIDHKEDRRVEARIFCTKYITSTKRDPDSGWHVSGHFAQTLEVVRGSSRYYPAEFNAGVFEIYGFGWRSLEAMLEEKWETLPWEELSEEEVETLTQDLQAN